MSTFPSDFPLCFLLPKLALTGEVVHTYDPIQKVLEFKVIPSFRSSLDYTVIGPILKKKRKEKTTNLSVKQTNKQTKGQ